MADNEVLLRGTLRHEPEQRELPSGDVLVTLRLVVRRGEPGERAGADWVDCAVWTSRLRRQVCSWHAGDLVEVRGELRRRFFRVASGATTTRLEVEVLAGKLLKRAAVAAAG